MEFRDVVWRRRMVRNYAPDPVSPGTIAEILELARRAPSAGFSQGQRFVVVTDAATRQAIAELGDESHYVAEGFDPWMSRAPVHIVVCADERAYVERYAEPDKLPDERRRAAGASAAEDWPIPYWHVDAGASLMLVLLGAVDQGLAAGFFGTHRLPGLKALLGIPDDVHPIGIVTLGHPAPDRRSGSLRRGWRDLEDVVHWGRWGGRRAP
jgi:nitroreductase